MLLELIFVELSTLILRVGLRLLASLFCGSFVLFAFFTARNEITIENHKGIQIFEKNKIKINTNMAPIEIKGNNFEILYIAANTITIKGYFDSIEYVR